MKKIFFLIALFIITFNLTSQTNFQGSITYSVEYSGEGIESLINQSKSNEIKIFVSGDKSKTEMDQSGVILTVIKDASKKEILTLMDISMIGKKILIRTKEDDIKKELQNLPEAKIELKSETKEIAGYLCKKAEYIIKDNEGNDIKSDIYYTEELGTLEQNFDGPFKDIKGTLMEYEQNTGKINMKFTAVKVKKQKISEKEFAIPEGYEEMTKEQIQELFGQ